MVKNRTTHPSIKKKEEDNVSKNNVSNGTLGQKISLQVCNFNKKDRKEKSRRTRKKNKQIGLS
jgi:hypothetical protein